ncbi:Uncharacterised protein [Serratia marcescens]|nr:Uncharacterised protein [Serratia marcescens]
MDHHRQQAAQRLQPQLMQILLQLAGGGVVIDQETAVVRQRLLMEPYLAVGIGVQQHEHAVGKLQRLLRQHAVPDRNIQQDPALRIAGDQLAHIVAPAFRLLLTLALHFQPFRRIQAAKGQKVEVFTVTQRPFLPAAAVPLRAGPAARQLERRVEMQAQQIVRREIDRQHRLAQLLQRPGERRRDRRRPHPTPQPLQRDHRHRSVAPRGLRQFGQQRPARHHLR